MEPVGASFCGMCGMPLKSSSSSRSAWSETRGSFEYGPSSELVQPIDGSYQYMPPSAVTPIAPGDDFDPNNLPPSSTEEGGNAIIALFLALAGLFLGLLPLGIGAIYFGKKAIDEHERDWKTLLAILLGIFEILLMISIPIALIILFVYYL